MKRLAAGALAALITVGCGKKGPPLPPLVRLPAPPDVQANRRGSTVEVAVVVPSANADGSRPANISRVDVYAITGSPTVSDADLIKHGTRVASLAVKAPRNPDDVAEQDEPVEEVEAPAGNGLDQGAGTTLRDDLSQAALVPADLRAGSKNAAPAADRPLLGLTPASIVRTYVGVGVSTRGKQGRLSRRSVISLTPPPPPPSSPTITYDEKSVTVAWTAGTADRPAPPPPAADEPELLPSHGLGPLPPSLAFNVYDTTSGALLTMNPVDEARYTDTRPLEWGSERCYGVRAVDRSNGMSVESEARAPRCAKLVDMFPPAAPKDLKAVSSEGVISLIWDANTESDLAGYLIFRAVAPSDQLQSVVTAPVQETSFNDGVQAGIRYVYAVKAVDKAGNASALSNRVEETAR